MLRFRHCLFGRAPSCFTSANQTNRAVAYCLQFSSPHCRAYFFPLLPLWSAGQTRLDWNLHSSGVWTTSLPCGLTQNACQRVFLILLLLCVFAFLTAELPLTVLYLSLPLRKLLQYLWFLCNGEWVIEWMCVCARVCLWMWMQGSGKSSTHLNKLFSCFTSIHPLFSLVAPCSLNQGFITKQVCQCPQMPRVDTVSGGGVTKDGKASCIFDKDLFS